MEFSAFCFLLRKGRPDMSHAINFLDNLARSERILRTLPQWFGER
jgi:hypothetical protein